MGESNVDKYLSEFLGTFLLVLTVTCNVLGGHEFAALSIACVLMVSVYALGSISGAHFNPAVTLAVTLSNKMEGGWARAVLYVIFQVLGGAVGAMVGFSTYNQSFNLEPQRDFGGVHACLCEFLFTAMLCFVVLNVAYAKGTSGNQFKGLAIGFVICSGGYATGPVSGGALNPAVALGIDLASIVKHGFGWSCWYLVFQFLGGVAAAVLFRFVRPEEFGDNAQAQNPMRKYLAEFIGTFYLVLSVGLNVLAKNNSAAFSIAATLMCMIYALGDVSGAHFNPAVTIAILMSGRNKCSHTDGAIYIVVQLLGGIAAGLLYYSVWGVTFPLGPQGVHNWAAVSVAEIIFTAVLCFVVLCVATVKEPSKDMFGLAIGMCVTVGGFAIGGISGGSLNPAVSVGIDTAHAIIADQYWHNCLAYSGLEIVGAALAAGTFYVTHQKQYNDYKVVSDYSSTVKK